MKIFGALILLACIGFGIERYWSSNRCLSQDWPIIKKYGGYWFMGCGFGINAYWLYLLITNI